jgi:hypothetical protein
LNGKTIAEKGDFADTSHWEKWKDLDYPVNLQKGKQTIKLILLKKSLGSFS